MGFASDVIDVTQASDDDQSDAQKVVSLAGSLFFQNLHTVPHFDRALSGTDDDFFCLVIVQANMPV